MFFERGGTLWQSSRTVAQTPGVAAAAIRAVFAGPNPPETAAGVGSAVPAGSRLRGISVSGGTATVDVSRAFAAAGDRASVRMRVAQLVYTATQFPAIDHVRLEVAGTVVHSIAGTPVPQPAARPSFYRLLPAILVAQPAIGERIPATCHDRRQRRRVRGGSDGADRQCKGPAARPAAHHRLVRHGLPGHVHGHAALPGRPLPAGDGRDLRQRRHDRPPARRARAGQADGPS